MKELRQITVIGLGLLGGSITLAVLRAFAGVKTIGYSHRSVTRLKARRLVVATVIADDIRKSVSNADLVILATNASNITRGIDRITAKLTKLKNAIKNGSRRQIESLLKAAKFKRGELIKYKMKNKELLL